MIDMSRETFLPFPLAPARVYPLAYPVSQKWFASSNCNANMTIKTIGVLSVR